MAQRTTKSQVSGYRFLLRRLEHALVRRDVRMIHDPMSAHVKAMVVGLVLTLVILGGAVAISFFKPQGSVGDSKILVSKQSGQLYVLLDSRLHPALNLASARLVTGSAEKPNSVSDSVLAKYTRGPQLGIPGAPSSLSAKGSPGASEWTVCDRLDEPKNPDGTPTVGVIVGALSDATSSRSMGPSDALYVRNGANYYVIYRNTRAQVDPGDNVVRQALGLQSVDARSVSSAMLDAIPPSRAILAPTIANAGRPTRFALNGARVGSIITVASLDASAGQKDRLYVVLDNGVQQVSPFVADLVRAAQSSSDQPIVVGLNALANVPQVDTLQVDGFPESAPTEVDGTGTKALCLAWSMRGDDQAQLGLALSDDFPVTDPEQMVSTVGSRRDGVGADLTYVPPGSGYFVRTVGVEPGSQRAASDFFVADTGVRYGVPAGAAAPLGMPTPLSAPYPIVRLMPPGPALARTQALVAQSDLSPTGSG